MPFCFGDLASASDTVPPASPTDIMPIERIAEFLEKMRRLSYEYGIGVSGEDMWLWAIPFDEAPCLYRCDSKGNVAFI
jgi:hypothetical protein